MWNCFCSLLQSSGAWCSHAILYYNLYYITAYLLFTQYCLIHFPYNFLILFHIFLPLGIFRKICCVPRNMIIAIALHLYAPTFQISGENIVVQNPWWEHRLDWGYYPSLYNLIHMEPEGLYNNIPLLQIINCAMVDTYRHTCYDIKMWLR